MEINQNVKGSYETLVSHEYPCATKITPTPNDYTIPEQLHYMLHMFLGISWYVYAMPTIIIEILCTPWVICCVSIYVVWGISS